MFRASMNRRLLARRGFTLIELLVVIAIIALLVSILMPSLSRAKDMAKAVSCMVNQKSLGTSSALYQSNNQEFAPWSMCGAPPNDTAYGYGMYYTDGAATSSTPKVFMYGWQLSQLGTEQAFECPGITWQSNMHAGKHWGFAKLYNCNPRSRPTVNDWGPMPMSAIVSPAAEMYLADSRSGYDSFASEAPYPFLPTNHLHTYNDAKGAHIGTMTSKAALGVDRVVDDRHLGRANLLFFDGHVAQYTDAQLTAQVYGSSDCIWDLD